MVLNKKGYTLLELLVAVSLSFFVVSVASVSYLRYLKHTHGLAEESPKQKIFSLFLHPWEEKIKKAPEAVFISDSEIWIQSSNQGQEKFNRYMLQEWLNKHLPDYVVSEFKIEAFGPQYSNDFYQVSKFKVPGIPDTDGNGMVNFDELDQNFSGDLTSEELYWVGFLKFKILIEGPEERFPFEFSLHPRNRWGLSEVGDAEL